MADPALEQAQVNAYEAADRAAALRTGFLRRTGPGVGLSPEVAERMAKVVGPIKFPFDEDLAKWVQVLDDPIITVDLLLQIQTIRLLKRLADGSQPPTAGPAKTSADGGGVAPAVSGHAPGT